MTAYERADKEVAHWTRILAGSLSPKQREAAQRCLKAAVAERTRAQEQTEEKNIEVVAA